MQMTFVICTQIRESFGIWIAVGEGMRGPFLPAQKEGWLDFS
jgi:hypothetical protein